MNKIKSKISILLIMAIVITEMVFPCNTAQAAEKVKIKNPIISYNGVSIRKNGGAMKKLYDATYDCVWFGSYPQAAVVKNEEDAERWLDYPGDKNYIIDANLYQILETSNDWKDNEITIDGVTYVRANVLDAINTATYKALSNDEYSYFAYQPIKWRVLSVSNNEALLLADRALDYKLNNELNELMKYVPWEKSTVRSWLNGFDETENDCGMYYSTGYSFIDVAFNVSEQGAIVSQKLKNEILIDGEISRLADTTDKVFLLSLSDVAKYYRYGGKEAVFEDSQAFNYGFMEDYDLMDQKRSVVATPYAESKGCYGGYCKDILGTLGDYKYPRVNWMLRSPHNSMPNFAADVSGAGGISLFGGVEGLGAIRPCVVIDLDKTADYKYAGTIKSSLIDYTQNEVEGGRYDGSGINRVPVKLPRNMPFSLLLPYDKEGHKAYLHFDLGGGYIPGNNYDKKYTKTKTGYKFVTVKRDGYSFKGWSIGEGKTFTSMSKSTLKKKVLALRHSDVWAVWAENKYTVKFSVKAPKKRVKVTKVDKVYKSKKVKYARDRVVMPRLEAAGYEFLGWCRSKKPKETDIIYSPGESYNKLATGDKKNKTVTLYPVWKEIQ